jgi:4-hydroxybenzoate polyprenyltransferase
VTTGVADSRTAPLLADLVAIARPEQWSKHIFIVPGLLVGLALTGNGFSLTVVGVGLLSACLLASANYVMNEWLDADFDSHHPIKGARPAAMGRLTPRLVYAEYAVLAVAGLALAATLSPAFFVTAMLFLAGAVVYNVRPLRAKERVHLDIIVEAANNPLRLLFGWFMASPVTLPPLSLLIMYWCSGAFLMATKRLAEYRYLVEWSGPELAARYRRSFHGYDQTSLILTCFLYAILASFSLAIFLIKYRAELVLAVPLFAWIFIHYLRVAMQERTLAESPEKFYRQRGLLPLLALLVAALTVLSFVDIPWVRDLAQSRFTAIELRR